MQLAACNHFDCWRIQCKQICSSTHTIIGFKYFSGWFLWFIGAQEGYFFTLCPHPSCVSHRAILSPFKRGIVFFILVFVKKYETRAMFPVWLYQINDMHLQQMDSAVYFHCLVFNKRAPCKKQRLNSCELTVILCRVALMTCKAVLINRKECFQTILRTLRSVWGSGWAVLAARIFGPEHELLDFNLLRSLGQGWAATPLSARYSLARPWTETVPHT